MCVCVSLSNANDLMDRQQLDGLVHGGVRCHLYFCGLRELRTPQGNGFDNVNFLETKDMLSIQ